MRNNECFDVTIIGGGSAGLFAAYYAGMRGMKTKIIEYHHDLGGTVSVFYPDKYIYDIGGIPKISGRDLISQIKEQAFRFDPTLILGQAVEGLKKMEDGLFKLTASSGETHYSKTVIIAAGPGLFKIRRPKLKNIEHYEDKGVHYEPKDLTGFAGKCTAVFGDVQSSCRMAVQLSKTARHVYLICSRSGSKGLEKEMEELLKANVEVKCPCTVTGLYGDKQHLSTVTVESTDKRKIENLNVDDFIISQGYHFDLDPVKNWGFSLNGRRIPVNEKMETKIEGVYAAGDIAGYPNKWRLIASAFNEAITAVNSAKARIDPSAPAQVYSSILMDN
ncbi:thioredoxin reductase (NADPH) [Scopulibacillus daqui]|uniref:Ferredoxin--NADP reductase n=1 Tax=Scopulibacillus daqui TaxID=1469162 RepID=A0ABS2PWW4_9BACL|nr:NAD(P)/FAD-dependent oxidoreductase [Scopulibacillus daqui]MBM7644525.1 thioredoxin reductase (NADPH) [Scopulibacillus daqui]